MTQYVINIGAIPNDGTGDPLRTAFNETNLNFDQVFAAGPVLSNIQIANNTILTTTTNGNLILAPNGIGRIQANATIVPSVANVRDLGSATQRWNTVYAQYLDLSGVLTTGDLIVDGNLTVQGNTIQIGNIVTDTKTIQLANTASNASSANGSGITVGLNDNIATMLYSSASNVWTTNIGLSSVGNITAPYFVGNGSQLTGVTSSYGNANVVTLLAGFGSNTVSTTGNISGGYLFGNGSQLTGLPAGYANANVVAYGESGWAGNIIPSGNAVYSLGNATNQWNDLYVSNATIFMNNVPISLGAGNVLTVNGEDVVVASNTGLVSVSSIDIGTTNFLVGDDDYLVFEGLVPGGIRPAETDTYNLGNVGKIWSEIHANVYYGNGSQLTGISAGANTGNVTFNDVNIIGDGNLRLQPDPANASAYLDIYLTAGPDIHIAGNGETVILGTDDFANVTVNVDGNVSIQANNGTPHTWTFDTAGNLNLPGNTIAINYADGNLAFGTVTFNNEAVIGTGTSNTVSGLYLAPDPVSLTNDLYLRVRGNILDEPTHIHFDTGNNQYYNQFIGDDNKYIQLANTGNIVINTNNYAGNTAQWNFDYNGVLTLPNADATGFGNIYFEQNSSTITFGLDDNTTPYLYSFSTLGITLPRGGATIRDTAGNAVAFGRDAAATGPQGNAAVAIGQQAGDTSQGTGAVAIGYKAGLNTQGDNSVGVGTQAGQITQGQFAVAIGDNAGNNTQGTDAVAIGASAGLTTQGTGAVAFGQGAGETSQGANAVALGKAAGQVNQGINSVAIGQSAGLTNQGNNSIILNATGSALDQTTANTFTVAPVRNDVANVGNVMFYNATSKEITYGNVISVAGNITGGNISTGVITLTNGATIRDTSGDAVAFGQNAGLTSQGNFAVGIGRNAGQTTQGGAAVAIGVSAGDTSQGNSAVAVGQSAGFTNQSANTVAVGVGAGQTSQGVDAVAVGASAGSLTQGIAAVAIGTLAGRTFQANNSIIINATGANLDQTTANTFTVAPVRNDVANIGEVVFYNTTSKEITYGNVISVAGNITGGNLSATGNITGNTAGFAIGYRDIPQVGFTGNATIATTDAGKHFYSTQSTDYILTIANNASQGFQTGAAITVVNQGTGNITLAQGSGVTLYLTGNATSGNRTVTTFGMATLIKVATDTWFVSGAGVI